MTLRVIEYLDNRFFNSIGWRFVRKILTAELIQKNSLKLSQSKDELDKYISARLFLFYFVRDDETTVEELIRHPAIYIAISASKVGFKYSIPTLINTTIDVFSQYRRVQRSILSSIANSIPLESEQIVIERLLCENDPFIRSLCYSMMMHFSMNETVQQQFTRIVKVFSNKILPPFHILQHLSEALLRDLNSSNINLRLASLNYAGKNPAYHNMVRHFLSDDDWQMRAAAARLTGALKDEKSIYILQLLLRDKQWWVRIRSAEALANIGEKGLEALRSINPSSDKFAYEAAMQVLIASHHQELK